jgi:hypothetical protein
MFSPDECETRPQDLSAAFHDAALTSLMTGGEPR